jgi:hypothetical protein
MLREEAEGIRLEPESGPDGVVALVHEVAGRQDHHPAFLGHQPERAQDLVRRACVDAARSAAALAQNQELAADALDSQVRERAAVGAPGRRL